MEHKTKNWEILLIAEMEDEHLKNTIDLIIKNIENYFNMLKNKEELDINNIIYWRRNFTKAELKNFIKNSSERLVFYIFEAQIRWYDYSEKLQKVFWRNGKIEQNYISLPQNKENDYLDYDEVPF